MNEKSTPIALITGASRGLGRNAALRLAERGWDLILTYRSGHAEASKLKDEITALGRRAVTLALDMEDVDSFTRFAGEVRSALDEHWKRSDFDHLVNNAGFGLHLPFSDVTVQQFDSLMNVHVKGVFFLTQKLLPLIADGGRILNVSTGLTRFTLPGFSAYAAAKGAVEVLTRGLAKELGPRGITVNSIAPGAIETDFDGGAVRDNPQLKGLIASQTALGRVGQPDDIGHMVALLMSDGAGWVTGQRVEASGGMFL